LQFVPQENSPYHLSTDLVLAHVVEFDDQELPLNSKRMHKLHPKCKIHFKDSNSYGVVVVKEPSTKYSDSLEESIPNA